MENSDLPHADSNDAISVVEHSTAARAVIRENDNNDAELDSVVDDVANLSASDDDPEDEDEYPRTIRIRFPNEAAILHDISEVEISIRKILDHIISQDSEEAEEIIRLRDDFYGGDSGDDNILMSSPGPSFSWEERAELQVERRRSEGERARARARLQNSDTQIVGYDEVMATYPNECAEIRIERDVIFALMKVVEARWRVFVLERDRLTEEQANSRREELYAEANRLDELRAENSERSLALCERLDARRNTADRPA